MFIDYPNWNKSYKLVETKVDKYLTVCVQNNRYSLPPEYKNKKVTVELGLYDVRITFKNKLVAQHNRSFHRHKWILDPWHYMRILQYKPKAFKSSRILSSIEENWDPIVKKLWLLQVEKYGEIQGTKQTIKVLLYFEDKQYSDLVTTLELALESKVTSYESIILLFESLNEPVTKTEDIHLGEIEPISGFSIPPVDIDKFDQLCQEICYE